MKVGDEINFMNNSIKFQSLSTSKEINYTSLKGRFEIVNKNNNSSIFYPEIRIYDQPSVLTSEADIKTDIYSDNFLVFNLLKNDGYFNVRYQFKPLMIWIWLSVIMISLGGIISFLRSK